jgi:hypothetical protein
MADQATQPPIAEPAQPEAAPRRVRRRSGHFTKRDVQRAVEAVKAAGLQIAAVRIEPDGTIQVVPGEPVPAQKPNPWD